MDFREKTNMPAQNVKGGSRPSPTINGLSDTLNDNLQAYEPAEIKTLGVDKMPVFRL